MKTQKFSDADIDNLIASVEETLQKSALLAKSGSLKKDDDSEADEQSPAADQAPAEAPAPEMEAAAPAPDAAAPEASEAPAQDAPPAEAAPEMEAAPQEGAPEQEAPAAEGQPDEQALEGEGQGEEAPLNDEELEQIYGGMDPQELERHYMIIRRHLEGAYAKAEEKESDEESEKDESKEEEQKEHDDMEKSEKFASLAKTVEEQKRAIEMMTKAFELLARPERKAVTDLAVIQKSEPEHKELSKSEIDERIRKVSPASLTKAERETVNAYLLHGEGKEQIEKIISKGGN